MARSRSGRSIRKPRFMSLRQLRIKLEASWIRRDGLLEGILSGLVATIGVAIEFYGFVMLASWVKLGVPARSPTVLGR